MKLTAYFDVCLLSSLSVSMQHQSSYRRNYPTYWHHLQQPSEYMATTSTSTNRQNHCAQHYAGAVETEFQKDVDQQSISWCLKYKEAMQVWQSLTVKAHFTLGKNKNKQIFMYLGYLLWWIFIYWAQKSSSLLSVI